MQPPNKRSVIQRGGGIARVEGLGEFKDIIFIVRGVVRVHGEEPAGVAAVRASGGGAAAGMGCGRKVRWVSLRFILG